MVDAFACGMHEMWVKVVVNARGWRKFLNFFYWVASAAVEASAVSESEEGWRY
jgi:hypothetical protein